MKNILYNDYELRLYNCRLKEQRGIELFIRLFELLEDKILMKKYAEALV